MKIQTKLLIGFNAVFLIAIILLSFIFGTQLEKTMMEEVDGKLLTAARFASTVLPPDYHDRIVDSGSVSPEDYERIVATWDRLCVDLGFQYIWSLMTLNDQIVFTSGSSTSKDVRNGDYARFLEVHTNPGAYETAFRTMEIQYSTFVDKWGEGRMVLLPAYDSKGRKYLFATSIPLEKVNQQLQTLNIRIGLIGILVFMLGLPVSLYLARSISRPIVRLTQAAGEIAAGKFEQPLVESGNEEIRLLSHSFTEMSIRISDMLKTVAESEARWQMLVETAPDSIFVQTGGRFAYLNSAALRLFNAGTAQDLLGTPILDRIHPHFHDVVLQRLKQADEGQKELPHMEQKYLKMDGSPVEVEVSVVPIQYRGQAGTLVFARDIGERKNMERTLVENEKMAGIGTLAAGIAHEINTPLQIITGISETTRQRVVDQRPITHEDLVRRLENINSNAWRIARIVRSLLDYARSSSGQTETVGINEIIHQMLLLVEHQLKSWANISIETELAEDLPAITCDEGQLTQVLINLVNNARDAMPGGGKITIRTGYDAPTENVLVRIADTGSGIPLNIREKIFDPFFTTKPAGQGTGLGLSLVSGILRAHGGSIELESTSSQGSVFLIRLPLSPPPG